MEVMKDYCFKKCSVGVMKTIVWLNTNIARGAIFPFDMMVNSILISTVALQMNKSCLLQGIRKLVLKMSLDALWGLSHLT